MLKTVCGESNQNDQDYQNDYASSILADERGQSECAAFFEWFSRCRNFRCNHRSPAWYVDF